MIDDLRWLLVPLFALALASQPATAVQLDVTACDQLKSELGALEKAGARVNFEKGAAWAKANLSKDQLGQIEKLIDTEAQFLFRCPQPKRTIDAATAAVMENGTGSDPDPDAVKSDAGETPSAKPTAGPRAKTKPAPVAATKVEGAGDNVPVKPKPKRAAAKPKPADAFSPEAPGKSATTSGTSAPQ